MRFPYSLLMILRERNRYLPAVLAVAFSDQLITMQVALVIGTLSVLSMPIDHTSADVWVTTRDVLTLEMGHPLPETWMSRIASQPEVEQIESFLYSFAYWNKPRGGSEVCCVIGSRLDEGALGAVYDLTPEMRAQLTEPGAVVVDESELERFGLRGVGDVAEVLGVKVRLVGVVHGFKSIGGACVFCSLRTARLVQPMFRENPGDTMYLLVRCRHPEQAAQLAARLSEFPDMTAFPSQDFSWRTRMYWLTRTKAGLGMACTSVLGLLVGLVVTSQTLYAAVASSLREYAVLQALGIPRLAHGDPGADPIVLDRAGRHWRGGAGGLRPGRRRRQRGGQGLPAGLADRERRGGDHGHGSRVRSGGSASLRLVEPITLLR